MDNPMLYILFLGLLSLIYFDANICRKIDGASFGSSFRIAPTMRVMFVAVLLIITAFSSDKLYALLIMALSFGIPLYLSLRNKFFKTQSNQQTTILQSDQWMLDANAVVLKWFFGMLLCTFFIKVFFKIRPEFDSEFSEMLVMAIVSSVLLFILVYNASQKFSPNGFLTNVALRKGNQSYLKVFILPMLIGLACAYLASLILLSRVIQPETPLSEAMGESSSSLAFSIFIFLAILVAPFLEEIVFRGYFFHVIKKYKNTVFAVVIIASIFALLHVGQYWGDWAAILMVTFLGYVLTLLRVWTGSTVASVVTHYFYNGGVTIIPVIILYFTNPSFVNYHIYFEDHNFEQKVELLEKSIEVKPQFMEAYYELAKLYQEEDTDLEYALDLINHALSANEKHKRFLRLKAEILYQLNRIEEAYEVETFLEQEK